MTRLLLLLLPALASTSELWSLLDDLFEDEDYNKDVIPMEEVAATDSAEHAVTVGLGVTVRNLDICPAGVMTLDMWLKLTWTDYRLAWDPQQYDGLSSFRIPSNKIWRPDIAVYNEQNLGQGSFFDQMQQDRILAVVYSTGKVIWIPPMRAVADCNTKEVLGDGQRPHTCKLKLGSWTYDGFHLNLTEYTPGEGLHLGDMNKNSRYLITSQQPDPIKSKFYSCCPEPYMSMEYNFNAQQAFTIEEGRKVFQLSSEEINAIFADSGSFEENSEHSDK